MRRSKIASITVSFSWMFMIIIGAFFIIMSYNIIQKYQANEEAKFELEVQQSLRAILNNVGRTSGVEENSLEPVGNIFKDSEVTMICEAEVPIISINDNLDPNNQFLRNYPSFMNFIKEGEISFTYIAVENFKLPFKINNMLALVSRKNIIVLDENSEISQQLLDKFNRGSYENLNYVVRDFNTFNGDLLWQEHREQNPSTMVFVSDAGVQPVDLTQVNTLAYNVQVQKLDDFTGRIIYTDINGGVTEFNYIDYYDASYQEPSLGLITMAVFSTPEIFSCSYEMLIRQISSTFDFYIEKAELLSSKAETTQVCSSTIVKNNPDEGFDGSFQVFYYDELIDDLKVARNQILTEKFNNPEIVYNTITSIEESSRKLEEFNCIYVY